MARAFSRLLLMMLALTFAMMCQGCQPPASETRGWIFNDAEILAHLKTFGIEGRNGIANYWQDPRGESVFVPLGTNRVAILRKDAAQPEVVNTAGWSRHRWTDGRGVVRDLPSIAARAEDPAYVTEIDQQSGLFVQYRRGDDVFNIGRIGRESWLLTGAMDDGFTPARVAGRDGTVLVLDNGGWFTSPFIAMNPNCRVYTAESATDDGPYRQTDEFRLNGNFLAVDPVRPVVLCRGFDGKYVRYDWTTQRTIGPSVPSGKCVALLLEHDWLTPRLRAGEMEMKERER